MKNKTLLTLAIVLNALALITLVILLTTGDLIIFEDGSFILGKISNINGNWAIIERWATGCIPFNLCR